LRSGTIVVKGSALAGQAERYLEERKTMESDHQGNTATAFDASRRYVRVCQQRADGFVEFEFAIGSPELCVELMLPVGAFHEFCLANSVILLEPLTSDQGDWVHRLNQASHQEYGEKL
jgi:phenol/toluene 2-monooxygenase (NADH) P0/A0